MKKYLTREFILRVVLLLVGLCIAHLGVTLFLQADMGSDPFNVMIQGLFRTIPWPAWAPITFGRTHLMVSVLIMLVLLVVDRGYVRIGTLLCMALGGPIIDVYTIFLDPVLNSGSPMPVRFVSLALGCVILAAGMTVVIKSEAGTGPNDLVAVVISEKGKKPFGIIRCIVDFSFALIGFLLGGTIGVGTVVCVILVGPTAQRFMPISERFCKRVLGID